TSKPLIPFVSPATRFEAGLSNATKRPSAEIEGEELTEFPCAPPVATLTRSVVPLWRSRTKMSGFAFVSPTTRFVAQPVNATNRPSAEIEDSRLKEFPSAPLESTLTRSVVPLSRSCTKLSEFAFVSLATRFVEELTKATTRPS